ncbi:MAG: site-specific integrase, partial [Shimia sp.]|nr:site-specific integrase [Shimia sp.]
PWDLGKKGSRRAICASVNQKRSDMFTARFQTVKHAIRRKSMGPDPKVRAKAKNHAAMDWRSLPAFYDSLRQRDATAAYALRFTILTGARTGETLGMVWEEMDFEARLWTVPAMRMKAENEHRVPLCDEAVEILSRMRDLQSRYVFEGQKRHKPLSNMSMSMLLRRMDIQDATVHGFRSTFRDWTSEVAKAPREVAELCLSHRIGNQVEQAYARSDLLEDRRRLMTRWGAFVAGETGKVVRLG